MNHRRLNRFDYAIAEARPRGWMPPPDRTSPGADKMRQQHRRIVAELERLGVSTADAWQRGSMPACGCSRVQPLSAG